MRRNNVDSRTPFVVAMLLAHTIKSSIKHGEKIYRQPFSGWWNASKYFRLHFDILLPDAAFYTSSCFVDPREIYFFEDDKSSFRLKHAKQLAPREIVSLFLFQRPLSILFTDRDTRPKFGNLPVYLHKANNGSTKFISSVIIMLQRNSTHPVWVSFLLVITTRI